MVVELEANGASGHCVVCDFPAPLACVLGVPIARAGHHRIRNFDPPSDAGDHVDRRPR